MKGEVLESTMKTLEEENLERIRVVKDRHMVGLTYNKLLLQVKAEAIAEVIRALGPEISISDLEKYHDKLVEESKE